MNYKTYSCISSYVTLYKHSYSTSNWMHQCPFRLRHYKSFIDTLGSGLFQVFILYSLTPPPYPIPFTYPPSSTHPTTPLLHWPKISVYIIVRLQNTGVYKIYNLKAMGSGALASLIRPCYKLRIVSCVLKSNLFRS